MSVQDAIGHGSELHSRSCTNAGAFFSGNVADFERTEAKGIRKQHCREALPGRVVVRRSGVESAPSGGKLVFNVSQLALKGDEIGVGLEIGIPKGLTLKGMSPVVSVHCMPIP